MDKIEAGDMVIIRKQEWPDWLAQKGMVLEVYGDDGASVFCFNPPVGWNYIYDWRLIDLKKLCCENKYNTTDN